jgi:hypothetical protein
MSSQCPPIIIVGMHRSGTTMITKMLENLGLFVGQSKEVNNEALFFYDINNWIFKICYARADLPHNLQYLNPVTKKFLILSLRYHLSSIRRLSFLGAKKFFAYQSIQSLDIPWGWKDPKNTFTYELWKEIFPQAKIIHIYRNPIDSVSSFIVRDLEVKNKYHLSWKKKIKRLFLISERYHPNFRLYSLEEGYNLWEEYVSKAFSIEDDPAKIMHIRYEDFLAKPKENLSLLADFCGLNPDMELLEFQAATVKKDRSFAFLSNPEDLKVYHTIKDKPLMQKLHYDKLAD